MAFTYELKFRVQVYYALRLRINRVSFSPWFVYAEG